MWVDGKARPACGRVVRAHRVEHGGGGRAMVGGGAGRMADEGMGQCGGALTLTSIANHGSCAFGLYFPSGRDFFSKGKDLNSDE